MRFRHPAVPVAAALVAAGLTSPLAQAHEVASTSGHQRWATVSGYLVTTGDEDPAYAVVADQGPPVPVTGDLAGAAGDRVTVRVQVPSALDVLDGSWRSRENLDTWGRPLAAQVTHQAEVTAATTPVQHTVYVARPTNVGGFTLTDDQLLDEIGAVAEYWRDEAEDQITGFDLPDGADDSGQFATYATTATVDEVCTFGGDSSFYTLAGEAEAQFPGAHFSGPGTTDLLVVMTPDKVACPGGSPSGRGTLGTGFAGGGVTMARGGPALVRGGIAHEMGHNFGFGHSNLGDLEYLNLYNVMAGGVANMNQLTALSTAYRVGAGIAEPGEIRTVAIPDPTQPVTRTETVAPRTSVEGQRALAVTPPDTGETFYVEYRSGQDRDADSPYVHGLSVNGYAFRPGVVVEEVRWGAGHGVSLLTDRDTRFRTATIDGETWTSPSGTVTVSVAATDASGAEVTVAYAPPPAFDGGEVALSGIPMVGSSVAANLTGITPAPAKVTWQWLRDGSPIPSATASSYVPSGADEGHELSVEAMAFAPGRLPKEVDSARQIVQPGVWTWTTQPRLSSSAPIVGQSLAVVFDQPGPAESHTVQWYADGNPVGPTTQNLAFLPTTSELGRRLSARVTLESPGWITTSLVTPDSAPVAAPVAPSTQPTPALPGVLTGPKPVIKGKAVVGKRLTVKTGGWPAGTRFTYRWLANGKVVRKATAATLTVKPVLEGKKLSVRVTAAKPGYTRVTVTSARTKRVRG